MKDFVIAKRYASALLKLSKDAEHIEDVRSGLESFLKIIRESGRFFVWLTDEEISKAKKQQLVREIGGVVSLPPLVLKFIEVLIAKGRIKYITLIVRVFNDMADDAEETKRGEIFVADKSSGDSVKGDFEKYLAKKLNKKIYLTVKEDRALIGGVMLKAAGCIWDASIKRRLDEIKESLCL